MRGPQAGWHRRRRQQAAAWLCGSALRVRGCLALPACGNVLIYSIFYLCLCRHRSSTTASRSSAAQLPRRRRNARIAAASQPPNIDLDALLGELEAPEIDADLATLQAEQVGAACWMDEGQIACLPACLPAAGRLACKRELCFALPSPCLLATNR